MVSPVISHTCFFLPCEIQRTIPPPHPHSHSVRMYYLGVDHQFSIAYSKEENGIVERANKEVMRHLRNIMFDNGALDQWSRYLPIVQNIMNSAIHSATGFSPAQMIFGTINNMSQGLIFPRNIAPPTRFATTDYVSELFKSQRRLIEAAAESLRKRDKQHLSQKTNNHQLYGPITSFEVDQFVLDTVHQFRYYLITDLIL